MPRNMKRNLILLCASCLYAQLFGLQIYSFSIFCIQQANVYFRHIHSLSLLKEFNYCQNYAFSSYLALQQMFSLDSRSGIMEENSPSVLGGGGSSSPQTFYSYGLKW